MRPKALLNSIVIIPSKNRECKGKIRNILRNAVLNALRKPGKTGAGAGVYHHFL